ncbi:MAG: hypothetical protein EBR05_11990 [Marivivens sp.]|jgi:hypothetical protein|nr:hypothetical protein [Marivivens sp.]
MILTKAQRHALYRVWMRDETIAPSYLEFRRRAVLDTMMDCVMIQWHGMWLGIEPDGYTHS